MQGNFSEYQGQNSPTQYFKSEQIKPYSYKLQTTAL